MHRQKNMHQIGTATPELHNLNTWGGFMILAKAHNTDNHEDLWIFLDH